MKNNICIVDTNLLCIWLKVPHMETAGSPPDFWDYTRVETLINQAIAEKKNLVMPLAAIIETGNHITNSKGDVYKAATAFVELITKASEGSIPWIYFGEQIELWEQETVIRLAKDWLAHVSSKLSIGDVSIKQVADFYSKAGNNVEILTSDGGLRAYTPEKSSIPPPRRNK